MYKNLLITMLGALLLFGCPQNVNSEISPTQKGETEVKSSTPHFETIIAQIVKNEIVFTSSIDDKVSKWEKLINMGSSLNLNFDVVDIEIDNNNYYLVGIDDKAKAVSKIRLVLDNGVLYEAKFAGEAKDVPNTGWTCICSGCTSTGPGSAGECSLKQDENGWYCTDCSEGTCTKTEVAGDNGIISTN